MIKAIPEWSKQEYLMLSLPHEKTDWKPYLNEILKAYENFINHVSKFQKVLLIAPSEKDFKPFKHMQNIEFFICDTNDTWIRDYGPIEILDNNVIKVLNFKFNAWGNKFKSELDNALNSKLFKDKFKENIKDIDFILEGGSVDFNGQGVLLTTKDCLLNSNRNSHLNQKEIETHLKEFFGLSRIIWLENGFIQGDDTDHHIDTLARFIDENTIAYSICENEKDIHFKPLKAMEHELLKTGFNLVKLPLPSPIFYDNKRLGASYANFVFINNALIVPFYNDKNDLIVKENLEKVIKNRQIIGVDARVFLRQNGSLHCACNNLFKGQK
ncbi:agamatine deiminase [Campylobacter sp. LR291e]|uniref:agmatine deiminase family protein n=1 Tax=Campylobacter sp. LR291e TaxID=2593546 RepID=UPI00123C06D7|nr:agmatine deiminase family protein [Campylobacter sp. LR291e]KAA6234092.1 agamatine deiminase [Campylobacter sp. LR291e]